jgi:signal transduction histidine kinase
MPQRHARVAPATDKRLSPLGGLDALMETLAESEQSLKVADWLAKLGTFNYQPTDVTLRCTPNIYDFFGMKPDGRAPDYAAGLAMLSPANQRDVARILTPAGGCDSFALRLEIACADGSHRICWAEGRSVFDAKGALLAVTGVCQDVTEREAVAAQLQQAQKMEAVGQMTGGLAHDFNNLLAVIIDSLDVIDGELEPDSPAREFAASAVAAALKGAQLTRQLLAFSRRQPLIPRTLDLNELLDGMGSLWKPTLGDSIDFRLRKAANLWTTLADGSQVESALLNLAINARDAMPEGGLLTVETRNFRLERDAAVQGQYAPAGDYATIAVSDTGHGIAAAVLPSVFEPFFTTKAVGKGSGLGLSMVYGFAKQSGGHVQIMSEVGVGTTVRLFLPRTCGEVVRPSEPAAGRAAPSPRAHNETVLVVEDNADVRRIAVRQLGELGYVTIEAESGPAALDRLLERHDVDLLFTDMVLPGGMTGNQLAIAAVKLKPRLKVLYTTGCASDAVRDNTLMAGSQLLSKPYRKAALGLKLRETLDA